MKQTDPREKETYEPPLVQDLEPVTVTYGVGDTIKTDDPDDWSGGV